jgi:hypothetical protein
MEYISLIIVLISNSVNSISNFLVLRQNVDEFFFNKIFVEFFMLNQHKNKKFNRKSEFCLGYIWHDRLIKRTATSVNCLKHSLSSNPSHQFSVTKLLKSTFLLYFYIKIFVFLFFFEKLFFISYKIRKRFSMCVISFLWVCNNHNIAILERHRRIGE